MKVTGILRRVDDLGRIAIPKEVRRQLDIREGQTMEFFTDKDMFVVLQKSDVQDGDKLPYISTGVEVETPLGTIVAKSCTDKDIQLEELWRQFGDVPMNPETECIEEVFLHFPAGTNRMDIWHWFDEQHSLGVAYLIRQKDNMKCGECKHCRPNDVCNGDCLCDALGIEVSKDDDTRFYSENGSEPCEMFTAKEATA